MPYSWRNNFPVRGRTNHPPLFERGLIALTKGTLR